MRTQLFSWTLLLGVVVCSVQGQVVLDPLVSGTASSRYYRLVAPYYGSTHTNQQYCVNPDRASAGLYHIHMIIPSSHYSFHSYYIRDNSYRVVLEFDIQQTAGGDPFPMEDMTTNNWVAHINDLRVNYADDVGDFMGVDIHEMVGDAENGALTTDDFLAGADQPFHNLFQTIPPAGTVYSGIDVTEQLREDLFGMVKPVNTSGYILMPDNNGPGRDYELRTRFDLDQANITVQVFTPVPTTPTPQLPCRYDGDMDNNGILTPDDALTAFEIYLLIVSDPTEEELCSADCNHDETVTPGDAYCVFSHYLSGECDCVDEVGLY